MVVRIEIQGTEAASMPRTSRTVHRVRGFSRVSRPRFPKLLEVNVSRCLGIGDQAERRPTPRAIVQPWQRFKPRNLRSRRASVSTVNNDCFRDLTDFAAAGSWDQAKRRVMASYREWMRAVRLDDGATASNNPNYVYGCQRVEG